MNRFSHSKISTFRQCNKKYYYQYVEGIQVKDSKELVLGQIFHRILEAHYANKDVQPILNEYQGLVMTGELETHRDLMESVYQEYLKHYRKEMASETLVHNEQRFEIAFDENEEDLMVGIVDKIIQVGSTTILRDHKTTSNSLKYEPHHVRYSSQLLLYKEMAEILTSMEIDALEVDEIRLAMVETEVPLNRDGRPTVDRRKLSLVTYETYHNKLVELGLDGDPDYANILGELERRGHPLFRRTMVAMIDGALTRTNLQDIEATMRQIKREKTFARNPGRLCDWCPFKEICQFDYYDPDPMDREIIKRKL